MSPRSDVDLDSQHRSPRECAALVSKPHAVALRMLIRRPKKRLETPSEISRRRTRDAFFPFKDNSLPNAKQMLHAQAHQSDADPAAQTHKDGFAARLNQLDYIGVETNRRHSHNNEELGELLYGRGHARR